MTIKMELYSEIKKGGVGLKNRKHPLSNIGKVGNFQSAGV